MTKDVTPAGTPQPPRAEPLQPDRPGRGSESEKTTEDDAVKPDPKAAAEKQRAQSRDALKNVREGYGG